MIPEHLDLQFEVAKHPAPVRRVWVSVHGRFEMTSSQFTKQSENQRRRKTKDLIRWQPTIRPQQSQMNDRRTADGRHKLTGKQTPLTASGHVC